MFKIFSKPSKKQRKKAKAKIDAIERRAKIMGRAKAQSKRK